MKHKKLTKNELRAVTEAAESVVSRYDYISKLDFLIEVKNLLPEGKNNIKAALVVWERHYEVWG